MAGTDRLAADSLSAIETLRSRPQGFSLFAALRVLENVNVDRPRVGEARRPGDEAVRCGQPPYLTFAPTEVAGIDVDSRWRLQQYVFGMFGPMGALPLHLTELAFERLHHHDDPTLAAFIDALQHRFISFFYRAWAASEPAVQADRLGTDEFKQVLASLVGLDVPGARDRDSVPDCSKASRAGLFTPQSRSADALEALLGDYFGLKFQVNPYVARWLDIPAEAYLRLANHDTAELGRGATLGRSTWQANHSFELVMGPVSLTDLERFLPGERGLEELRDLLRFFTADEWQWQLRIIVQRRTVPDLALGGAARLGWTSWLAGKGEIAGDVVLQGDRPGKTALHSHNG